jgi:hypothetical protein
MTRPQRAEYADCCCPFEVERLCGGCEEWEAAVAAWDERADSFDPDGAADDRADQMKDDDIHGR